MPATINVFSEDNDSLVLEGVEQILIFKCRTLHLLPGDAVRFSYMFQVDGYTNRVLTSQLVDPIKITKTVSKPTTVRSIIVKVTDGKQTLELSEAERPDGIML